MTDPQDHHFMRLALETCLRGVEAGQSPFAACIVQPGQALACEHNQVWLQGDPTAHAEVQAIRSACHRLGQIHLEGATLYSTTEPCPMCFAAIHWARIGRIVFAARVEDARRFGFNELPVSNQTLKQISGSAVQLEADFLREEALAIYARWQARADRRVY